MNLPNIKKVSLITTLLVGGLGILLGILLLAVNPDFLLKIIFVVMGIVTVLSALPALLSGGRGRGGRVGMIIAMITLIIGIMMIFWHSTFLMIILGLYMLVFPLVEILAAHDKLAELGRNLPQMIVGLVLILIGPNKALGVVLDIAGAAVILLSVVYIVVSLLGELRRQTKREATTGNRIFVDNTGDGKVDVVYVDTTGDGKPDTAKRYREKK